MRFFGEKVLIESDYSDFNLSTHFRNHKKERRVTKLINEICDEYHISETRAYKWLNKKEEEIEFFKKEKRGEFPQFITYYTLSQSS